MPELPEVECFARALDKHFSHKKIKTFVIHRNELRIKLDIKKLNQIFATGETLTQVYRVGKRVVLQTAQGKAIVSLGMTGAFSMQPSESRHQHISILFADNSFLAYVDPRRFGIWTAAMLAENIAQAADPLSASELLKLFTQLVKSVRPVKTMLLDQNLIGGIGNIYASEALFIAHINPSRTCASISSKEFKKLAQVLPELLNLAIDQGGSSVATYQNLVGKKGNFQKFHKVYGKNGEACTTKRCTGTITRIVQSGRATFYCPQCQK